MNYRHFKYEGWLYGLAFLLALGLRLIGLGHMPLNDFEAQLALQSLRLADGSKPILDAHPAYILFTTVFFFLYGGGTNVLARLVPALAGSALVFAPLLFADRLKPRPSLILAFFIALDPGFTAISRQAGSPILAITFFTFALGYLNKKDVQKAGLFAALALLGGPSIWAGLLGLGITLAIYQLAKLRFSAQSDGTPFTVNLKEALLPFAATFLLAGTLFSLVPNGLSSALDSIPEYLRGWTRPSAIHISWMFISLLAYQAFAVLLSILALIRGWIAGSRRIVPLSIWMFVALLLAVFYPARQIHYLAWMLLPLYAIASLELARYMDVLPEERMEAVGAILLTAFLWVFGWVNFSMLIWRAPGDASFNQYLLLVISSILLLVVSLILVAFGWSVRIAQFGLVWGLGLAFSVLGLGGTLGSTGLRGASNPELWWPMNVPKQADLLVQTVDDLSEWGTGYDDGLSVIIRDINSPALEWALREHNPVLAETLDISSSPALVITSYEADPALANTYRGQDFVWRMTTSWEVAQPVDWFKWLTYREMTQSGENIILWARSDLFISATP
jgi:hypothetical protein